MMALCQFYNAYEVHYSYKSIEFSGFKLKEQENDLPENLLDMHDHVGDNAVHLQDNGQHQFAPNKMILYD